MVKGTSRRVVIVRSPKPEVFDEAIFILRDGAGARGVTADDLLCEALRTAEEYAFAEGFPPARPPPRGGGGIRRNN